MAIAYSNLGTSIGLGNDTASNPDINDTTGATSYSNSSWTPPTTGIICVFIHSRRGGGPDTPSVSGNSLTWTQIGTTLNDGDGAGGLSLFAALASPATTGATTVDFGSNTQVHCTASFFQVTGVDTSGGIGGVFVQTPATLNATGTGTSGSITLAAAGNSNNRPISFFWHLVAEAVTERTNWTEIDDMQGVARNRGMNSQIRTDAFETTASASWATSDKWAGIAAELKADVGAAKVIKDPIYSGMVPFKR